MNVEAIPRFLNGLSYGRVRPSRWGDLLKTLQGGGGVGSVAR